jgi:molybdate transport system substrate-binding protein
LTEQLLSQLPLGPKPASRYLYRKHNEVIDLLNSGEADVGVVYRADVVANPKLRIIDEVPDGINRSHRRRAAWKRENNSRREAP